MIEEYRGIYFRNKNSDGPQKKFYEHGAHFEYKALYKILKEIIKKIKPRINSSIPKRKNTSLNRKRAVSCRKKKLKSKLIKKKNEENINRQKMIKLNLSILKRKNEKNRLNNSLIIRRKKLKNFNSGKTYKNFNNLSFNKILGNKYSYNKKFNKYNSSIINNSMENLYNDNRFILNESSDNNYKYKIINSKIYKMNRKFNAIALTDFSKKNDNIIFSFNKNKTIKKDSSGKISKYFREKNNNLITKENKHESIGEFLHPFSLKENPNKTEKLKMKNSLNISNIKLNSIKNGARKYYIFKKNLVYDNYQIKTQRYKYHNSKKNEEKIKKKKSSFINKYSNKENLKLYRYKKSNEKKKFSRNKENLKMANSFFNNDNNGQLTLNNINNSNMIIKNETEKKYLNLSNLYLLKEKGGTKMENKNKIENRHSVENKYKKKDIKNKFLEKNKLKLGIKENANYSKISNPSKHEEQKKINIEKNKINYYYNKKTDNNFFTGSTKSNNDSINKSKSNKNGDKKSIISTTFTSHINSNGIIIPLYRRKIDINKA